MPDMVRIPENNSPPLPGVGMNPEPAAINPEPVIDPQQAVITPPEDGPQVAPEPMPAPRDTILNEDNIAPGYLARQERAYADQSPAVQALKKYLSPEEFNQYAPTFGASPVTLPVTKPETKPPDGSIERDRARSRYTLPTGLMVLQVGGKKVTAAPELADALEAANQDMLAATGKPILVTSSFRTKEQQQKLYDELKPKGARVATPGKSFHERGMAIDVQNWKEAEPFLRKYGLANDLADDKVHFSMGETNRAPQTARMMPSAGSGVGEANWKTSSSQLAELSMPQRPPAIQGPGSQQMALDLLLAGWKSEEIESEINGGLDQPLYSPVDLLADIASGGIMPAGRTAIEAIAQGSVKEGTKALGKSVGREVLTGAIVGESMNAAEAAGAGPILQLFAGVLGPTATVALMQLPRKGFATYLQRLETDNPDTYRKLAEILEKNPDHPVIRKIKDVLTEQAEFAKRTLASERGSIKTGTAEGLPPIQPIKAELPFEQNPKALLTRPRDVSYIGEHLVADENTLEMLQKYAGNVNLERIDDFKAPDDIRNLINTTAERLPVELDEARRGTITLESTKKLSDELGWSEETLLKRQRGQAFNAEQITASRLIMMNSAADLLDMAKQIRAGNNSDEMLAVFRERLSRHAAIQAQVAGLTAEAGRALSVFRITAKAGDLRFQEIQGVIETSGGRGNVEKMVEVLTDIADRQGGKLDLGQINAVTKKLQKATTRDALLEAWIMGLLSGPQTHAVNMLGNTITALWQVPERKLASWISQSPIGSGEIQAGEAAAQAFGLVQGFRDGLILAGKALKTGEGSDLLGKVETPRRAIAAGTFGADPSSVLGRGIDYLGEAVRLPGRFLGAEDELFKAVGYRMEINAQAYRQAVSEGLQGEPLAKRIAELVENPPDNIKLAGIDAARYQTYTNPLGEGGRMFQAALNKIPGARIIVPFFRTPVNILKFSIERTPLAPAMASVRADIMAGGARRDLALARIGLGSSIMAVTGAAAAAGQITGAGPSDKDMRDILKRKGWQPYSLKFGDTYVSYNRLDPIGMLLGIAADSAEIMGQVGEAEADRIAGAALASISQNLLSKTYLRGVSDFVNVFSEAQRYENANRGRDYITKLIGSVVPTLIAQFERTTDPTVEDTHLFTGFEAVTAGIKARIPGYSKDLPPRRNLWGEPIVMEGGLGPDLISPVYTSTEKYSPIDDELLRLKMPVKMPPPNIGGVELTPDEYDRYVTLAGHEAKDPNSGVGLKAALESLIKSDEYKRQSDGDPEEGFEGGKALQIRAYVKAYRELAKEQLFKEFPDLGKLVQERQVVRAKTLQPKF